MLLTHAHWDHAGGVARYPRATVWVREAELQWLASMYKEQTTRERGDGGSDPQQACETEDGDGAGGGEDGCTRCGVDGDGVKENDQELQSLQLQQQHEVQRLQLRNPSQQPGHQQDSQHPRAGEREPQLPGQTEPSQLPRAPEEPLIAGHVSTCLGGGEGGEGELRGGVSFRDYVALQKVQVRADTMGAWCVRVHVLALRRETRRMFRKITPLI